MRMLPECEKEKRKYFRFFKPRQSPAVSLFRLKTRSNNRSRRLLRFAARYRGASRS